MWLARKPEAPVTCSDVRCSSLETVLVSGDMMAYQNKSRRNYRHGRWFLRRPGGVLEVTERWIWERLVKDPSLLKLEGASTNHRSNRRIPNPCPVTRRSYFRWVPGEVINCTVFEGGRTPSRSSSAFIIADRQWPRRNSRESSDFT